MNKFGKTPFTGEIGVLITQAILVDKMKVAYAPLGHCDKCQAKRCGMIAIANGNPLAARIIWRGADAFNVDEKVISPRLAGKARQVCRLNDALCFSDLMSQVV